jgi:hypothetical protein
VEHSARDRENIIPFLPAVELTCIECFECSRIRKGISHLPNPNFNVFVDAPGAVEWKNGPGIEPSIRAGIKSIHRLSERKHQR